MQLFNFSVLHTLLVFFTNYTGESGDKKTRELWMQLYLILISVFYIHCISFFYIILTKTFNFLKNTHFRCWQFNKFDWQKKMGPQYSSVNLTWSIHINWMLLRCYFRSNCKTITINCSLKFVLNMPQQSFNKTNFFVKQILHAISEANVKQLNAAWSLY